MNAPFDPTKLMPASGWPFGSLVPLKYRLFSIDPAWTFSGGTKGRPQHYKRMTDAEIGALPLRALAHPQGAWILCWITSSMDGPRFWENIWPAWKDQGIKYSSRFAVWIKTHGEVEDDGAFSVDDLAMGQGLTTRKNAEDCLLFRIGAPKRHSCSVREVIVAQRREHSRKPDAFFERASAYAPGPYADVFSREERPGWDCYGDELGKFGGLA